MTKLLVHNTAGNKKEEFKSIEKGKVGMYVCGVTVYDRCHLGHARAVVLFDIVYRFLKELGYEVKYVRNFTDIDDKIINRVNQLYNNPDDLKEKCRELTEKYIEKFKEDFGKLNVLSPDVEPKATEHIPDIIEAISVLIDKGFAYNKDGDVFYKVREFKDYGKLSGRTIDDLICGARVGVNEKKNDPLDFALWKKSKDNEPYWDSPWGHGRPGWHIECSVMSKKYLGDHFDIHGGGNDLIFPHHENEIAQSEAITGRDYVNYWIHNGFVTINKEKMSKSTGNFFALDDIYKQYDPRILRLFLISRHYRVPLDYSVDLLNESKTAWLRIEDNIVGITNQLEKTDLKTDDLDQESYLKFIKAMSDDFNTSKAVSVLYDLVRHMNTAVNNDRIDLNLLEKYNTFIKIVNVLGLTLKTAQSDKDISENGFLRASVVLTDTNSFEPDDELNNLLKKGIAENKRIGDFVKWRLLSKKDKDFATADKIRDYIQECGYCLRDTKDGTDYFKS